MTVTGVADANTANETVTITHDVTGGDYGSVTVADVLVTVTDDDATLPNVDSTAPRVVEISRNDPNTSPTNADSLTWRVTFSETVANVDTTDFEVLGTTAVVANVQPVNGETGVYDVTASGGNLPTLDGTMVLGFAASWDIEDEAGNALSTTAPMGANDNSYLVDNTDPTVIWTPPVSLTVGTEITILPRTSDTDISSYGIIGLPDGLTINASNGEIGGIPTTESTSESTVVMTVTDSSGNSAEFPLTFPAVAAADTSAPDTTAPKVVITGVPETSAAPFTARITFNEPVTGFTVDDIVVGNAILSAFTEFTPDTIWSVLVTPVADGLVMLDIVADAAKDATGNGNEAAVQVRSTYTVQDTNPPVADTTDRTETVGEFLVGYAGTVVQQSVEIVRNRILVDRVPGFRGQFAGQVITPPSESVVAGQAEGDGAAGLGYDASAGLFGEDRDAFLALLEGRTDEDEMAATSLREMTAEEFLQGTAFTFTRETDAGLSLGFWGQASHSGFGRRSGTAGSIDGKVTGVQLGADWQRGPGLFGLMVSRSRSAVDVTGGTAPGEIKANLTALVPYASRRVSPDLSFWGAAGLGRGEMTFTSTANRASIQTDIDWSMATGGAQGALGDAPALGRAAIKWNADALWTRTRSDAAAQGQQLSLAATSGQRTRLRFGLEASWAQTLESGTTRTPWLSLGLRHDGGDAETGLGLEIGGGLDWRDPLRGLSVGVEGRALALHEERGVKDWGVLASFDYDPRPETRQGLSMALTHSLGGSTSGGVAALLGPETFPGASTGGTGDGAWNLEMAYGMGRDGGMVGSLYSQLGISGDRVRDLRLGYRIRPDAPHAADINVDLWAMPKIGAGQPAEVGASLQLNW